MKSRTGSFARLGSCCCAVALLLCSSALRSSFNHPAGPRPDPPRPDPRFKTSNYKSAIPEGLERQLEAETSEDPDGRADWFLFQRSYPTGIIPADARRIALEKVRRDAAAYHTDSEFHPLASNGWRAAGPSP